MVDEKEEEWGSRQGKRKEGRGEGERKKEEGEAEGGEGQRATGRRESIGRRGSWGEEWLWPGVEERAGEEDRREGKAKR